PTNSHRLMRSGSPGASSLPERLAERTSWTERFALVDQTLLGWTTDAPLPEPWVIGAWTELVASAGSTPIRDLVEQSGWSHPLIVVDGAEPLTAFLAASFGAVETERLAAPDGRIRHAEMRIADSLVMLSDARAENPARPCNVYVYVDDVDAIYQAAIAAGATS